MESITKGVLTELRCQTFLLEEGYNVSVPVVPARYDLILDVNNNLYKIQVKTAREHGTGFTFNCKSTHAKATRTNVIKPYTKNEIDYYMTFYNNSYFLIPVEDCGTSSKTLSFQKDIINSNGKSNYYKNYDAKEVLKQL